MFTFTSKNKARTECVCMLLVSGTLMILQAGASAWPAQVRECCTFPVFLRRRRRGPAGKQKCRSVSPSSTPGSVLTPSGSTETHAEALAQKQNVRHSLQLVELGPHDLFTKSLCNLIMLNRTRYLNVLFKIRGTGRSTKRATNCSVTCGPLATRTLLLHI